MVYQETVPTDPSGAALIAARFDDSGDPLFQVRLGALLPRAVAVDANGTLFCVSDDPGAGGLDVLAVPAAGAGCQRYHVDLCGSGVDAGTCTASAQTPSRSTSIRTSWAMD